MPVKEWEWSTDGGDDEASVRRVRTFGGMNDQYQLIYQRGEGFSMNAVLYSTTDALPACEWYGAVEVMQEPEAHTFTPESGSAWAFLEGHGVELWSEERVVLQFSMGLN